MTSSQVSSTKGSAFRRQQTWWTHPAFIVSFAVMVAIGAGVYVGIRSLGYKYVDVTFAFFWCVMLAAAVVIYRASVSRTTHRIDRSFVDRQRKELEEGRVKIRNDFLEFEMRSLEQGLKTPVLDVWKLDAALQKRHPYFSCLDGVFLDPASRELQIRVQIDQLEQSEAVGRMLKKDASTFFSVMAGDPGVRLLRRFFDSVILTAYSLREDERQVDIPYPVMSVKMRKNDLARAAVASGFDLATIAAVRVSNGMEVEPHCDIGSANQLKGK